MSTNDHIALAQALISLSPGAKFVLRGDTYADLDWQDDITKPTADSVTAEIARLANPVPAQISDRQFFQQLAIVGAITTEEALAAVKTGAIPADLQTFVDTLPEGQRFAAEMLLSGATVFERNHPMTLALGTGMGWTTEQLDGLWQAASAL